ncbi:S-layer protein [Levilactobacillus brevis]|uniref:S-layer protein n=1 Tax=Levilactobacillus brevis TaxID=1580 RepID=UPI000A2FE560|nr:S-layer protein [Levilactobacillus brevis]ARQ92722.1 S-layer protein [Levilactobacillus brevis]
MQSSLKKSLYLGLAALSFAGVAAVSTTASAKSYATAGAYSTLKTDAATRNVEATGTNALYTKPGTVKGAKVVASKATMAKLASSKKSADYFRAYGVKTTNRGSVYYRVVSMDGKYRGYVYGGSSDTAFAGGIKSAETTTKADMPARTTGFYLTDTSKNTLWTAPKYTQYKASKVSLYGVAKDTKFTVDQAATKTREGSLYYHVTATNGSGISGWIYAGKGFSTTATGTQVLGGLSTDKSVTATNDNSVKIVYRTTDGTQVGSNTWVTSTDGTKAGSKVSDKAADQTALEAYINANKPSGYTVTNPNAADATYGNTVYATVSQAATSKVALKVSGAPVTTALTTADANDKVAANDTTADGSSVAGSTVYAAGTKLAQLTTDLTGKKGQVVTLTAIDTDLEDATFTGTTTYYSDLGNAYHYTYTYNKDSAATSNASTQFGSNVTGTLTATLVMGKSTATANGTTWFN